MVQWGKALIAPDGSSRVAFSVSFPSACVDARAIAEGNVQPSFSIASLTNEGVSFKHNASGGVFAGWIALGM